MQGPNLKIGQILPISRRIATPADPLALFEALTDSGNRSDTVLLESADSARGVALRSILVTRCAVRATCTGSRVGLEALTANGRSALEHVEPRLAQLGSVSRDDETLVFEPADANLADGSAGLGERQRLRAPSCLDALRAMVFGFDLVANPGPLSMVCPGIFAYDLIEHFEPLPDVPRGADDFPDFVFWLPEEMVVIDHAAATTTVLRHVYGGSESRGCYHDAVDAIDRLTDSVAAATSRTATSDATSPPVATSDDAPHARVDVSDADFADAVDKLKEHIFAGDVFQAVTSRTFEAPCEDSLSAYRRLRAENPSPYMFYVRRDEDVVFGASPETCVKVDSPEKGSAPKHVEIRPIAGTRPRGFGPDGVDPDLDARMEADLRLDTKELAEHMMLVDLARNDVARVSRTGTRQVTRLLGVDRYSHVMHLVSHVRGELAADLDALHAYAGSMNMGTLVGAPKVRAAQLVRDSEGNRRGIYGGAVGYLTPDGDMDTAIIIRSAHVRDGVARVRAGAGVVADSDPVAETDETRRKARAVLRALQNNQEIR
ncbi:MAG: anthranilate synthase component 1 [Persicimonas sp.]